MIRLRGRPIAAIIDRYGPSLIAYGCVSVASALIEWLTFYVALSWLSPPPAALVAFVIATAANFLLSRHLAFRSTRPYWKEFTLVMGMSAIPYVGNFALFYLLYTAADVNVMLAKILGTCFGFGFNFAIRQFFIFSRVPRFRPASTILQGKVGAPTSGEAPHLYVSPPERRP